MEFARHNLQVNTIVPEAIEVVCFHTPNDDQGGMGLGIPAGRADVTDNVRSLAVFLCSPGAASITGQITWADGGLTSRMVGG